MNEKEVYFNEWCPKCIYRNKEEYEDPCNTCLTNTVNVDSHKPTEFKPAGGKK